MPTGSVVYKKVAENKSTVTYRHSSGREVIVPKHIIGGEYGIPKEG